MYYRYYHDPGRSQHPRPLRRPHRHAQVIYYWKKDQWELYDLVKDPAEMHNIYGQPGQEKLTATLKAELQRLKKAMKDDDQLATDQLPNGVDGPIAKLRGK